MIKKIIPFILILIILAGLFGPVGEAQAQSGEGIQGICSIPATASESAYEQRGVNITECRDLTPGVNPIPWRSETAPEGQVGFAYTANTANSEDVDLGCNLLLGGWSGLKGCIAATFYLFWTVSATIAELGGKFLDFFVYYSVDSNSYRNTFVERGWAVVRDVANIFFIIALLYIAIKTVLSLEGSNSKKLIANIIIIALIINFSLFATKVVIDGTNILTKVFYNSITSVDGTGVELRAGAGGQKSISVGLIDKYNPQKIFNNDKDLIQANIGTFIFMTLVLFAITIYTAYVFFAVALLFVARVISLWLSMIFAPLAFISYTVPFDIPGFGHKIWWSNLLKNAFLAPLFVFFLYIIVMFADFLKNSDALYPKNEADTMQHIMGVVIPFAILMALLMKAKKLAVEYSGDMGKAVMTVGKMAGGLALGGVAGVSALAGRQVIGRAGAAVADSRFAKGWASLGMGGNTFQRMAKGLGSASFDARGIKAGGQTLAGVTGMKMGEAQKGGIIQSRKEKVEKRQKRYEALKVGENETLKQNLNRMEDDLQSLLTDNIHDIEKFDQDIKDAKEINDPVAIKAAIDAKKAFVNGLSVNTIDNNGKNISTTAATLKTNIFNQKSKIVETNKVRANRYADHIQGNWFTRIVLPYKGGKANREAAHKIRMETKIPENKGDAH